MTINTYQATYIVVSVGVTYYVFSIRHEFVNFKQPIVVLLFGFFMLSVAILYDLIVYGLDNRIIFDHLTLSLTDPYSIFLIVAVSYLLILYGLEAIILIFIKKNKKD